MTATAPTIRLMVVEDNPAQLLLTERAFRDHKGSVRWDLTIAIDGEQAINILFSEENTHSPLPDLILLDWNLPGISGGEVLYRVKQDPSLCRIPVLVFSTSRADRDINEAYCKHANGYLPKPWSMDTLEEMVEAVGMFWITMAQLPKVKRGIS